MSPSKRTILLLAAYFFASPLFFSSAILADENDASPNNTQVDALYDGCNPSNKEGKLMYVMDKRIPPSEGPFMGLHITGDVEPVRNQGARPPDRGTLCATRPGPAAGGLRRRCRG